MHAYRRNTIHETSQHTRGIQGHGTALKLALINYSPYVASSCHDEVAERSKALDSGLPGHVQEKLLVRKGVGSNPTLVIPYCAEIHFQRMHSNPRHSLLRSNPRHSLARGDIFPAHSLLDGRLLTYYSFGPDLEEHYTFFPRPRKHGDACSLVARTVLQPYVQQHAVSGLYCCQPAAAIMRWP